MDCILATRIHRTNLQYTLSCTFYNQFDTNIFTFLQLTLSIISKRWRVTTFNYSFTLSKSTWTRMQYKYTEQWNHLSVFDSVKFHINQIAKRKHRAVKSPFWFWSSGFYVIFVHYTFRQGIQAATRNWLLGQWQTMARWIVPSLWLRHLMEHSKMRIHLIMRFLLRYYRYVW